MAIFTLKTFCQVAIFPFFMTKLTQKQIRIVAQHRLIIKLFAYPH